MLEAVGMHQAAHIESPNKINEIVRNHFRTRGKRKNQTAVHIEPPNLVLADDRELYIK